MSSVEKLENLFSQYSDLSREAIIKEELLTHGLSLDTELKFDDTRALLQLEGGPYALRRTIIRMIKENDSPYRIDINGEHLKVVAKESGDLIALAHPFPEVSVSQTRNFLNRTPYSALVSVDGEVSSIGVGTAAKEPNDIADEVAEVFVTRRREPREMPVCIFIRGENIDSIDEEQEADFYLQYVDSIRDRIGNQVPVLLETTPKSVDIEKRILRRGVDARLSNLGVWDQQLFPALCPGENKKIAWNEWIRRSLDQVYVFGWNAVFPRLTVGLEMAEPFGLKGTAAALASTGEGIRFLMMHGLVPNLIHWHAAGLSALAGQRQPPTEFFLDIDRIWYDAWVNYGQDEPVGYLMGPGRSRYPDSGVYDIGRGAPLKPDRKISSEKVQKC